MHCKEKDGKYQKQGEYLKKEDMPLIRRLAQKSYDQKMKKLIADTLFDLGIEYKYECPIVLKGYGVVYPDFTILSRKTGKEVYWEHDGKMDDPKYSEKAVRKINSYIYNGIIPGDRLMLTFETSNIVLNDRIIKKMIDNFLL